MKLEVIATNLEDVQVLNQSVADRIEFCHSLEVGGLTPDYESIQKAGENSRLPVNVMVRPHDKGYVYSDQEFAQMLQDVEFIASTKVAGIVVGVLTANGEIDITKLQKIIALKKEKTLTFHRAFQEVQDPIKGLRQLAGLGVERVLTSGTANINEGLDLLETLQKQQKVLIMAGGGVNFSNVNTIKTIVDEVHVGTAVREQPNWNSPLSLEKIMLMKKQIS